MINEVETRKMELIEYDSLVDGVKDIYNEFIDKPLNEKKVKLKLKLRELKKKKKKKNILEIVMIITSKKMMMIKYKYLKKEK